MLITDNSDRKRFELNMDGHIAFADYRREGNVLHIPHVEAPQELRGTGAAADLMRGVMEFARANQLKIHPICGYAAAWMGKHPEFHDLLE